MGRHFAAWLGLVPRQNSSGGKSHLVRISKQGNRYIRQLQNLGASRCCDTFAATETECRVAQSRRHEGSDHCPRDRRRRQHDARRKARGDLVRHACRLQRHRGRDQSRCLAAGASWQADHPYLRRGAEHHPQASGGFDRRRDRQPHPGSPRTVEEGRGRRCGTTVTTATFASVLAGLMPTHLGISVHCRTVCRRPRA